MPDCATTQESVASPCLSEIRRDGLAATGHTKQEKENQETRIRSTSETNIQLEVGVCSGIYLPFLLVSVFSCLADKKNIASLLAYNVWLGNSRIKNFFWRDRQAVRQWTDTCIVQSDIFARKKRKTGKNAISPRANSPWVYLKFYKRPESKNCSLPVNVFIYNF